MEQRAPVATQQFQVLFCQRFHCPPSEYEARAFRKCLYWHAKWLAPVLRRLRPDFFAEDFKFIRNLGESTGKRDADVDVANFHDVNTGKPSFWRTGWKIRVSGRKASRLAHELFSTKRQGGV
jgi:hypothetical protein